MRGLLSFSTVQESASDFSSSWKVEYFNQKAYGKPPSYKGVCFRPMVRKIKINITEQMGGKGTKNLSPRTKEKVSVNV